jgi:hypothetical protein
MISKCLVSASFKIHYQFIKKIELNKTVRARNLQGPPFFFFFGCLVLPFPFCFLALVLLGLCLARVYYKEKI